MSMKNYKQKLSEMTLSSEKPDFFHFIDVVVGFCDDIIDEPEMQEYYCSLAGQIVDCAELLRDSEIESLRNEVEQLRAWKASASTQTGIQDSKGQ